MYHQLMERVMKQKKVSPHLRIIVFLSLSLVIGLGFGLSWPAPQPLWAQSPLPTPVIGDIYMRAGRYPPTPTPTQTPTPTPTLPPNEHLDAASSSQANGNYVESILAYWDLLDDDPTPGQARRWATRR